MRRDSTVKSMVLRDVLDNIQYPGKNRNALF